LDEILAQGHRLLRGVDGALDGGEREHIPRKAQAVLRAARGTDEFSIVWAVPVVRQAPLVGLALFKLRVIKRELLIEYQDVLRLFQWGAAGIEKASRAAFVPHPLIAEHGQVGCTQHLVIGALREK